MSLWNSPSQYLGRDSKIELSVTELPKEESSQSETRSLPSEVHKFRDGADIGAPKYEAKLFSGVSLPSARSRCLVTSTFSWFPSFTAASRSPTQVFMVANCRSWVLKDQDRSSSSYGNVLLRWSVVFTCIAFLSGSVVAFTFSPKKSITELQSSST